MEPYFNLPQKETTEINPILTEILAPCRFPMESQLDSTLTYTVSTIIDQTTKWCVILKPRWTLEPPVLDHDPIGNL